MEHEKPPHISLLHRILEFCRDHGMSKTEFGIRALNDTGFVHGLEMGGREPRTVTRTKAYEFMTNHEEENQLNE